MAFYPLFIDLKNKKALIIGGGNVGSRRAAYLLKAGALVTVASKKFNKNLLEIKDRKLRLIKKDIGNKNLDKINFKDYFLVLISTNDKSVNEGIADKVRNKTLVCRADSYLGGDVVFPAVSKIGKNTVAFTTFGKNPQLSKKIKELLENNL